MKSTASHISVILTGVLLLAGTILLVASRLEYCGRPEVVRSRIDTASATHSPAPTPAPPQKMVFVHVEADKLDIEVDWAQN